MLKLIYIFGPVLIANSRCYGRCYVKQLIPPSAECGFKFHTRLKEKFGMIASKCLIFAFPRN